MGEKAVKKIKIMSIIVIICMILLLSTKVYAAERFELQISSEASNLNPGDTFTVDIVLDNMNVTSGDQGIGAYSAKITYDTSVLELVSVEQEEGWEVMENENNIVALTSNGEVAKERTKTATGTFKVKDNAKLGETSISLENISGSSGEATIAGTAVSKVITIEEKREENEENNPSGGDNTIGEGNNVGEENVVDNNVGENEIVIRNNTSIPTNVDSTTTAGKELPYTGLRNIAIIGILILIITSIVFYIKYRRAV